MKTPARILNDAADLIERQGLNKLSFAKLIPGTDAYDLNGPMCVIGALKVSAYDKLPGPTDALPSKQDKVAWRNYWQNRNRTKQAFQKLQAETDEWPAYWNDVPERTKYEVIDALREAARK